MEIVRSPEQAEDLALLQSRWDDAAAAQLAPEELLRYRSNLLGSDKRITNFGGGNTSSKILMKDPLRGEDENVLWVKGSGGDPGTMTLGDFATLYLANLRALQTLYHGPSTEAGTVR